MQYFIRIGEFEVDGMLVLAFWCFQGASSGCQQGTTPKLSIFFRSIEKMREISLIEVPTRGIDCTVGVIDKTYYNAKRCRCC
jgi:hypothetical protein